MAYTCAADSRCRPITGMAVVDASVGGADDAAAPADAASPDAQTRACSDVGPGGGTVSLLDAVKLVVAPRALDAAVRICISVAPESPPTGALTPLYRIEPEDLVLAVPADLLFSSPSVMGDVYWSRPAGGADHDDVGGERAGNTIVARLVHLGSGYLGPPGATRTVTGSQVVSRVSARGFQLVKRDLSTYAVAALVEAGDGYVTIPGRGFADGTFTIDGVPDGPYWLRAPAPQGGQGYYRTSASVIDGGFTRQGRQDAVPITKSPTNLIIHASGLAPWETGDAIEMFSSEAGSWYFGAEQYVSAGRPAIGDLSLSGFTFDATNAFAGTYYLIDGDHAPPDRFVVAQIERRLTAGGKAYQVMSRVLQAASFTQRDGVDTVVNGVFAEVPGAETLSADLRVSAFTAALAEEARPCTVPSWWGFGSWLAVLGVAGGLEHGAPLTFSTADLLFLEVPRSGGDLVAEGMTYGTELGGTWGAYAQVSFMDPCELALPGTSEAALFSGATGLQSGVETAALRKTAIMPVLGQVRAPKIAGLGLFSPQTGVGLTPELSWTAPSIGIPSYYEVDISRLFVDGNRTRRAAVASFRTDRTSVRLPAGVLLAGQAYAIRIGARLSAAADPSVLYRELLPDHRSSVLSAIVRP